MKKVVLLPFSCHETSHSVVLRLPFEAADAGYVVSVLIRGLG